MEQTLKNIFDRQKEAFIAEGDPSLDLRMDRIDRAINLLRTNGRAICEAIQSDFGCRSIGMSMGADIVSSIGALNHAKEHLAEWMKAEPRHVDEGLAELGAYTSIRRQPKGVVGIISPWNFPVGLIFCPLAGVLAAGNRAMVKPSEFTPATSGLVARLVSESFSSDEIYVVIGDADIGAKFSRLPFDHLIFTGSTSVARHVMAEAGKNLVPVTLELGGKSPVVVGRSADLEISANRIIYGKTMNAGQICLAPDYAFVPAGLVSDFVVNLKTAVESMYPTGLVGNDDYTSIINKSHYDRLNSYIEDAESKGAEIVDLAPTQELSAMEAELKIAPKAIVGATDEMTVMQDEIFGPLLPIVAYDHLQDAISYVNDHARPLGLYYLGTDEKESDALISRTISGGVTINDVMFHAGQEDLPLGGVGASGMGSYHGKHGFDEFSHKKAIFKQADADVLAFFRPPYDSEYDEIIRQLMDA
jgi:coniferyl-aldehyde dehydrogenase